MFSCVYELNRQSVYIKAPLKLRNNKKEQQPETLGLAGRRSCASWDPAIISVENVQQACGGSVFQQANSERARLICQYDY